uniref:Uncharacterized protein n=1 Tax=Daucus carota subsp. sativus TaxID=79200 RepID=A0A166DSD8_DAUCS
MSRELLGKSRWGGASSAEKFDFFSKNCELARAQQSLTRTRDKLKTDDVSFYLGLR